MRNASVALKNHLEQELTTLATCWKITRRDGTDYYFTDLDVDVTFGNNVYLSRVGYDRTAITNSAGLKTDELDLSGFFRDDSLQEIDMRNGLFDFADVEIFIVNYDDLSQGRMMLRRGNLGEVEISPSGAFKAELRGLTQRLSQFIGEKYQAECRADLGDNRCKIPINPSLIRRQEPYTQSEWVRVPTGSARRYSAPAVNLDFNSNLAGWTIESGNPSAQFIGEKYQAECRADLGDNRCKIPINPSLIRRQEPYTQSEWVRVPTGSARRYSAPAVNLDFNSNLAGWTIESGNPSAQFINNSVRAYSGSRFLFGGFDALDFRISQIVDLRTATDFDEAAVDNGDVSLTSSIRRTTTFENHRDSGRFRIIALNENDNPITSIWNTNYEVTPFNEWVLRFITDAILPSGTRKLKLICDGFLGDGDDVNAAFDDIRIELIDTSGGLYSIYENRIYEVITSGTTAEESPLYNTTVGAETIDGTATLKCYEAWSRHAQVLTVTNNRVFTINVTEARAVDDWFNGGAVLWSSGANRGISMEIKDWIAASNTLTLFLPMPNPVADGDYLRVYPGCDKRLTTCRGKFFMRDSINFDSGNQFNFRGEPFLPGRDHVSRYPDAK